ncbi:glycosyltransferase [Candidatus Pelagibacter sp.]|nr:glycosyltransferase [Candidatus Pelagibacter sp.]
MKVITLNLIIPYKNEEKNIISFFSQLKKVKKKLINDKIKIELTFIDDNSKQNENSIVIKNCKKKFINSVLIINEKNYGSHFSCLNALRYNKSDLSLFYWSDLELKINEIFELVKIYRKYKKPICISYLNKYSFRENIFSFIFWKFFSILYFFNIKNYFSILIDKKNYKKLTYKLKLTDLIFVKFFKNINNFKFHFTMLDKRKYGKTKWTLNKKIMLFYNALIHGSLFTKTLIVLFLFLSTYLNIFFLLLIIYFIYIETKMLILKNEIFKFKVNKL